MEEMIELAYADAEEAPQQKLMEEQMFKLEIMVDIHRMFHMRNKIFFGNNIC